MRLKEFDIDVPDVDADGIAEAQQLGGAGNLVLNGALCDAGTAGQFDIGDAYSSGVGGVQIGIASAGNIATVVFTVTGKDPDGHPQTETITGVNANTVESVNYWSQITQIAADAAVGSDVTVGTVDEVITKTYPIDRRSDSQCAIAVDVTGTIDFTVQETFEEIQITGFYPQQHAAWHNITALAAKTADTVGQATLGANAIRLRLNSYSSGAELQMHISQRAAISGIY